MTGLCVRKVICLAALEKLLTPSKNRQSCPLANSRYATVRSHPTKSTIYLYIKTIERCHMPSKMWEKIKLSNNYSKALGQIEERLQVRCHGIHYETVQALTECSVVLSQVSHTQVQTVCAS